MKSQVPRVMIAAFGVIALGALTLKGPRALLYLAPLAAALWLLRPGAKQNAS